MNTLIALLAAVGCFVSMANAATTGTPEPKNTKQGVLANLTKRGASSVMAMAQETASQTDEQRGGSFGRSLSTKITDHGLNKGLSKIVEKNPSMAAAVPLIKMMTPMISQKVGDLVDGFGKRKQAEQQAGQETEPPKDEAAKAEAPKVDEPAKEESAKEEESKESVEHKENEQPKTEGADDKEGVWDKMKNAVGLDSDKTKEDEKNSNEEAKKSTDEQEKEASTSPESEKRRR